MKSFAEDRKNKTDQLLLTSPVSLVEIVLGKYLAMVTVFAIPCVIYCIFPLIIKLQGTAHFLVDYSSILAFFLLGCVFIAIGMFLSSLTESPVIAAIILVQHCFSFICWTICCSIFLPVRSVSGHLDHYICSDWSSDLPYHKKSDDRWHCHWHWVYRWYRCLFCEENIA